MRPHCQVGKLPGCRERRQYRRCECPVKLLPVCLLGAGLGCVKRQKGHRCECKKSMMPLCFALGCEKRKQGRDCKCPRTPGEPCPCVLALARRKLIVQLSVAWWGSRLSEFDDYLEPELPEPDVATTHEARIILMDARKNLGVGLWHPLDVRSPRLGQEEELQERRRVDFLRVLLKGGDHGAA